MWAARQPNYPLVGSMETPESLVHEPSSHGLGGCKDDGAQELGVHAFDVVGDEEADGQTATDFCSRLFKEVPGPLLPTPSPPPHPTLHRPCRPRKTLVATCSSVRLAAKPSSVPVAERAQRKLMRELDFVNPQHLAPDAAVTEYIDKYGDDLPEQAVKAIRAAERLDNKQLLKALAAMVEESDVAEMDAQ